MKQSRLQSFTKAAIGTAAGFGLGLLCQWLFFVVWLGLPVPLMTNAAFAVIMTVVSLGRQFTLERIFEFFRISRPLTPFMLAVIEECFRQREKEFWSTEHDDEHEVGELARAGAAYLYVGSITDRETRERFARGPDFFAWFSVLWPWSLEWWKPKVDDRRRDLVRGCALGIAEGDKCDRQRRRKAA